MKSAINDIFHCAKSSRDLHRSGFCEEMKIMVQQLKNEVTVLKAQTHILDCEVMKLQNELSKFQDL